MKVVEAEIRALLPDDMKNVPLDLTKKGIGNLVREVAIRNPENYGEFVNALKELGRQGSYLDGLTLSFEDFEPLVEKEALLKQMKSEIKFLEKSTKNKKLQEAKKLQIWQKYANKLTDLSMQRGREKGSKLAAIIYSGARGNPTQYRAMIATPALYTDYKDEVIPYFVERSFSEGIRPVDMLVSTFGTRKSILATKNSTADAGDLGKQLVQVARKAQVYAEDPIKDNGILLSVEDNSMIGRVLQQDVGSIKKGTIIDRAIWAKLRDKGGKVLVYSPLADTHKTGIAAKSFGLDFNRRLPPVGFAAGVTAGNSVEEPLAQSSLNTKHLGGAFSGEKKVFSGFEYLSQFVQVPDTFKDAAAVSRVSGMVTAISDAPQGGTLITVDDLTHYVLPEFDLFVKEGDMVERGQILSDGLANPDHIVRTRGLGEGRKYFAARFKKLLDDSGQEANARNIETITKSFLDNVRVTKPEWKGYYEGDVISYNTIAHNWKPRSSSRYVSPKNPAARDMWLDDHILHYTIGTKLTPSMLEELTEAGIQQIPINNEPPPFEPEMIRLRTATFENSEDWLSRTATSYLGKNVEESAVLGYDTNYLENPDPFPRIGYGVNFAKNTRGNF